MRDQKDLNTMKKGVNKIKNQGENWYKMIKNCKMRDFGEKLGQLLPEWLCEIEFP